MAAVVRERRPHDKRWSRCARLRASREQPHHPRRLPGRPPYPGGWIGRSRLHRPAPFNTGRVQKRETAPHGAGRRGRPHRLRRSPLQDRARLAGPRLRRPRSTITSLSSSRASAKRIGCSRRPAASTSTSTTARCTTARCCSTASLAAPRSSTRSSGPTTTGARSTTRWPAKHDNILFYVKDPASYPLRHRRGRSHPVHGPGPRR